MPVVSFAQKKYRKSNRWKSYRMEAHLGLGASNFLGELGGANQIGTNYFKDLEFNQTRMAAVVGLRYKLTEYFAINTKFTYGKVTGDDKLTTEFFRNYRNLSFRSNILELSTNFEASFMKERFGARYRLRGIRGSRGYEMYVYTFGGIGVFYFNPQAQIGGKWYDLQPLHTEGQTHFANREPYSRIQIALPIGLGFKYTFDRRWGLGLELGLRKTFTDYIDDVSRTYYDNNLILQTEGPLAAALADRSDGEFPSITSPGAQRGDPRDKDSYMFGVININYKILTGRDLFPRF